MPAICRCCVGAFAVLAIGLGLIQPSLNSLISRRAGRDEQGQVLGVTQSVGSLARVIGPPLAGYLFAGLGRGSPFLGGAVVVTPSPFCWRSTCLAGSAPRRSPSLSRRSARAE